MAEKSATGITAQLESLGLISGRMKTGTPPRVDGRSLNYTKMEEQAGDENPSKFSYSTETLPLKNQRSCHITYTNDRVHNILREGFEDSPMYNGSIQGLGPRYCPSIEDKINRFAERERHQIFVEPEGWNTIEIYVNGFSTSLPDEIQIRAMQQIPGFENAKIFRPGYAIEYDFFQPTQLKATLETKAIENLFFAGQINGTTGYEEAAAQGLMAGINAHAKANEKEPLVLGRDQAYIGVLIDDLINKGTDEPYRMFTSRAEYRISLRQDNADERLTPIGIQIGLAESHRVERLNKINYEASTITQLLAKESINMAEGEKYLPQLTSAIIEKTKAQKILLRPEVTITDIQKIPTFEGISQYEEESIQRAEIYLKYSTYIEREKEQAEKLNRLENIKIPQNFDYSKLQSMSMEAREKLKKIQPATIAQAKRISGVSPSDISVLLIHFGR